MPKAPINEKVTETVQSLKTLLENLTGLLALAVTELEQETTSTDSSTTTTAPAKPAPKKKRTRKAKPEPEEEEETEPEESDDSDDLPSLGDEEEEEEINLGDLARKWGKTCQKTTDDLRKMVKEFAPGSTGFSSLNAKQTKAIATAMKKDIDNA